MSNYAVIKNGIVANIVVADAEWASAQTDTVVEYTAANLAYIGGDYVGGFFYSPQPFASWIRSDGTWIAPVNMPTNAVEGHAYIWKEATRSWEDIEIPDGRLRQTLYTPIGDEFLD